MQSVALDVTAAPSEDDIGLVERELVSFNVDRSQPYDLTPLGVFVRNADGAALGGATAHTNWGWLTIDGFWLPQSLRRSGWGRRILAAAEEEARRRGCTRSRLYTYSFQAQGFYEKHGYTVFGILDDYPPGHRQIWLRKDLTISSRVYHIVAEDCISPFGIAGSVTTK